jgi:hypothetical protein
METQDNMKIEKEDKDSTIDSSSGKTSPDIAAAAAETKPETQIESLAWNAAELRSQSSREHWTTDRPGSSIYLLSRRQPLEMYAKAKLESEKQARRRIPRSKA